MNPALVETAHRPYPMQDGPWIMSQAWHDLLFAHWPVEPEVVQATLPAGLEVDTFDGQAWIGVVPFRMSGVRLRGTPAMPGLSAFPELNVRTYVRAGGRSGVWFYSLDAANRVAVRVARAWFRLPYFDATMSCESESGSSDPGIRYTSRRTHRGAPAGELRGRYGPAGPEERARGGTLEYFLTERYALFAPDGNGGLRRGEVHHGPWPLQHAEVELELESVSAAAGFELSGPPVQAHFARRVDVRCWTPEPVGEPS